MLTACHRTFLSQTFLSPRTPGRLRLHRLQMVMATAMETAMVMETHHTRDLDHHLLPLPTDTSERMSDPLTVSVPQTMTHKVPGLEESHTMNDLDPLLGTMIVLRDTEMDILEVAGESAISLMTTSDHKSSLAGVKGDCGQLAKAYLCFAFAENDLILLYPMAHCI